MPRIFALILCELPPRSGLPALAPRYASSGRRGVGPAGGRFAPRPRPPPRPARPPGAPSALGAAGGAWAITRVTALNTAAIVNIQRVEVLLISGKFPSSSLVLTDISTDLT